MLINDHYTHLRFRGGQTESEDNAPSYRYVTTKGEVIAVRRRADCMVRRALFSVLALALPIHAEPIPDPHPAPWMSGEVLLQKLERPRKPSDPAEGAAYMMGIEDATADREWCYSKTKPGTTQLQPALLDLIRSLPPTEAKRNAALLAVRAWKKAWPCTPECCHG